MLEKITANPQVTPQIIGLRLDKFLCQKFDISFAIAQKLLRQKKILVNSQKIDGHYKIKDSDQIQLFCQLPSRTTQNKTNSQKKLSNQAIANFWQNLLYEDENLVAINKPSGLATQGGSGVDISVDDFAKQKNYHLLHRLDKDTSGVLLLAKNPVFAEKFKENFKAKLVKKTYLALVCGRVSKTEIRIEIPLLKKMVGKNEKVIPSKQEGKEAISELELIKAKEHFSIVQLLPITGRTHQLRVHCKEIGHPIVNDIKYGGLKTAIFRNSSNIENPSRFTKNSQKIPKKISRQRLCLHAKKVEIADYFGINKPLIITSADPDFFELTKRN